MKAGKITQLVALVSLLLATGCSQKLFESIFVVSRSSVLTTRREQDLASDFSQYLSQFGMTCDPYRQGSTMTCRETSGKNLVSTIKLRIDESELEFRVWTLQLVIPISATPKVHTNGERIVYDFVKDFEIVSTSTNVAGEILGPIVLPPVD